MSIIIDKRKQFIAIDSGGDVLVGTRDTGQDGAEYMEIRTTGTVVIDEDDLQAFGKWLEVPVIVSSQTVMTSYMDGSGGISVEDHGL
jgi:hypothetical protein